MDPRSLDAAAKALAQGVPRRGVLAGLLALAASSVLQRLSHPLRSLAAQDAQDACGVVCPEGQVLDETCTCVWVAPTGCGTLSDCGGFCVDIYADPFNCGGCGFFCESGVCSGGVCGAPAPASNLVACDFGLTDCFGICTDLAADPFNCGACGFACASGICSGGFCAEAPLACSPGLVDCFGTCADLLNDPFNCGNCGVICDSGLCLGGACDPGVIGAESLGGCTPPLVDCLGNGVCLDLSFDPDNCGACGIWCESRVCTGGVCQTVQTLGAQSQSMGSGGCVPPLVPCSGECVDLTSDPGNCGRCGVACRTPICNAGVCPSGGTARSACPANHEDCGGLGTCSLLTSDPENCGACGNACRAGESCIGGVCCTPQLQPDGRTGFGCAPPPLECGDLTDCGGACVDTASDPNHCGACGNACANGETCSAGSCLAARRETLTPRGILPETPSPETPTPEPTPTVGPAQPRLQCPTGSTACNGECVPQCDNGMVMDRANCRCVSQGPKETPAAQPSPTPGPSPTRTPGSSNPSATSTAGQAQQQTAPTGPEVAWVRPLPDFTGDCLYFAARARPRRSGDPLIESVEFTVRYQGTDWIDACTASQPSPDDPDLYECTWDHDTRRAVEGPVSVGFTVVDADGTRVRADADRHGEFRLPSTEPALQLPMQGNIRVVGNLPGSGDHLDADEFAVDLESDDPAVYPTAPGTVVYVDDSCESGPQTGPPCFGITVAIDHGAGWYSIYAHLADDEELPAFGDEVDIDTRIGTMSDSGCYDTSGRNLCGSKHLHFAVHTGVACQTGEDSIWETTEPVDVWTRIPGLPNPPATGPVAT